MEEPIDTHSTVPVHALRRLARSLLYDPHRAEDVVQEAWLAALQCERAPRDLGRWLAGAVRRLASNARREEARRAVRERRSARTEAQPAADELSAQLETLRGLLDAVDRLAEPYRTTIGLRFFDELPPRAIARRLDLPVETVRTRIKRGLRQLRRDLDGDGERSRARVLAALVPLAGRAPWGLAAGWASRADAGWRGTLLAQPHLALALCVVALGAGAWIFLQNDSPSERPTIAAPANLASSEPATRPTALVPLAEPTARTALEADGDVASVGWTVNGFCTRGPWEPFAGARLVGRVYAGASSTPQGTPIHEEHVFADASGSFVWTIQRSAGAVTVVVEPDVPDHLCVPAVDVVLPGDPSSNDWAVSAYPLDALVEGTVQDEAATPVAGALVYEPWIEEHPATSTDAEGRFSLRCSSMRRSTLMVAAPGFAPHRIELRNVSPASPLEHDVVLVPETRVRGRVVDEVGLPVADAEVTTTWDFRVYTATTDRSGRFEVGGLDPTAKEVRIGARKRGHAPIRQYFPPQPEQSLAERELEIVLETGARLTGRVVNGTGEPIEGVWVSFGSHYTEPRNETWTDAEGRFTLEHTRTGSHPLWLWRTGFAQRRHDLVIPLGGIEGLEITLLEGHFLAGVVVGADGQPVPRAIVAAEDAPRRTPPDVDGFSTRTGLDGRFRIDGLPNVGIQLTVLAPAHARLEHVVEQLDRDDLVLRPEGEAALAGSVVDDATGSPVPSFTIRASRLESGVDGTWWRDGVPFRDPEGRWQLSGIGAGERFVVEVSAEGYAPATSVVVSGDPARNHVVRLDRGTRVYGTVRDRSTGRPIAGARVARRVEPWARPRPIAMRTTTDETGSFEFAHVPRGPMSLEVEAEGSSTVEGPFQVGGRSVERRIELGGETGLVGRLLDADGNGVHGETIWLFGAEVVGDRRDWYAITDERGAYRIEDLPGGVFLLSWKRQRDGVAVQDLLQRVDLASGERREIDLRPGGLSTVRGTVAAAGELPEVLPIRLIPIRPWDSNGRSQGTRWADGHRGGFVVDHHFAIDDVEPGRWSVRVHLDADRQVDGESPAERSALHGSAEVVVPERGEIEVHLTLERVR